MTTLEILHWNDVHGRYAALARASHRAKQIRAEAEHPVLLMDGGDIEESSVRLSALSYGTSGWRALRAAGVDVAVPGNGGLMRYGPRVLPRYAEALGSPPVLANLGVDGGLLPGVAPYRLIDAGEVRVGVIGITVPASVYGSFGMQEFGLFQCVDRAARQVRREGADVVVVLSHCGVDLDRALSWDARGAVDLIVGGHTHTLLPDGDRAGLPIVQAGNYAEHLGRVRVQIEDGRVEVVSMTVEEIASGGPQDPAVLQEVSAAECDLEQWLAEPIGSSQGADFDPLTGGGAARLMAAALLARHPADVGVIFPAQLDAGLSTGVVRRCDLWALTSSPANAATATVTGAQLRRMALSGATDENAARSPRFLRGRSFGKLVMVGAEITDGEVLVGGERVRDDRVYRVTGCDIELSTYGGLFTAEPDDLVLHTPDILPEILEAYLVGT
ncbi:bifunctional metallophosphatase/5'-nucleotidase [Flexivirga caeni]|uniref:Bifunctional metallophosphatase/5'-nucleotidase n=1 Tax=Flexivirga caeni TaxID=2294115 RepID=A0A3M9MCE0_9MICO|nr:metallophosphoesterase [Flexivirga caeni]RNI22865.1 bifunctional metallophosphatase/5'-nucleotidase [Flexivirga caeni]